MTTLSLAQAAQPQQPPAGQTTIRTGVNLVQVDAVVTDTKDRQVTDLKAGDFEIPQLEVQTRLFRDGQTIYSGPPQIVRTGDQPDPKHLMAAGRIELGAKIAADDYILQIVVTDRLARRAATQSIDFSVE